MLRRMSADLVVGANLEIVRKRIAIAYSKASQRCGRLGGPLLVAVSKLQSEEKILACYQSGQRHFGENYIPELIEKAEKLREPCPEIEWHFIGTVQSNKLSKLVHGVPNLFCVQTISNQKHASILDGELGKVGRRLKIFIQVNTSGEHTKGGIETDSVTELADFIKKKCMNLEMTGLMTIGSVDQSLQQDENNDFARLVETRRLLTGKWNVSETSLDLSMGMSSDFELAIQYGSSLLRIGSTIFGPRLKTE